MRSKTLAMHKLSPIFAISIAGSFGHAAPSPAQESGGTGQIAPPVTIGSGGRIVRESAADTRAEAASPLHIHSQWESRYVLEGRDMLDGKSLLTFFNDFTFGPLTFAPWYGYSPDSNYSELNLSIVAATTVGDSLELYAGYTHLQFISDNLRDNEVGAGAVYGGIPLFDIGAKGYYSEAANGAFFEVIATRSLAFGEHLSISPSAILGFNAGYIADGHPGANNLLLNLEASYELHPKIALNAFASYTFAIDRDFSNYADDELLKDIFFGGVGIRVNF